MREVDWVVLIATLLFITIYGIAKNINNQTAESYVVGNRDMKWWAICISIMTTQASAVTFISTPGQGFEDGMRFVQFYFGLPIAMIVLSVFFVPLYYKMRVSTAYEFLETRFDLKTRTVTSLLFLTQRAMGAGLTIYAPAIVLSVLLGWDLKWTIVALSILTISYTTFGGYKAVAQTQQFQMLVIFLGLFLTFIILLNSLPDGIGLSQSLAIAGQTGKMNLVDFKVDFSDRYNFWSGVIGGFFLFMSYFGTDQSQVGRYLSGASLRESRLGLLFNGILKIPMQFFILLLGVLVFVFYIYNKPPIHFNPVNISIVEKSEEAPQWNKLKDEYNFLFYERQREYNNVLEHPEAKSEKIQSIEKTLGLMRSNADSLIKKVDPNLDTNDKDYVFISYVLSYLPVGMVGLLIAVIFSSSMSSKASELNALASTTVVDLYKRSIRRNKDDKHYLRATKFATVLWGLLAMAFAMFCSLFENLIQAVNIVGSLFYGAVLGVFAVAFFFKKIGGTAVFWAAILSEVVILTLYLLGEKGIINIAFLWYNLIGCVLVIILGIILQGLIPNKKL
ncbi:MAG: sodium:solute symporter [Saprospiraceae bacterium]|uniref:sodium:solute symporter n=1 Tax=Candidatus Brachybacter algidus TaxID=2982024 RepID=UPI001B580FFB|nr:sodium:solute symporter [Candidatus Brachybacter algidus]MBP7540038.1 sodium:solute symporter [Saprospiraceae bacterium]MBK6447855.1 sodium:solute symporter [Candidatus Brachybacter algidus]MBK8746887.1 sodium:solute symporter [Candidatus Brachybacter algidus]MBK9552347.1 sodium:solute symporter [Candidatus Brachybacter algidus]MBP8893828.1 sodium:solute symporter [Saprospiraceae bacterium]